MIAARQRERASLAWNASFAFPRFRWFLPLHFAR
jgi:hypothetical protein